ncbi:g4786 [Coccomyxa elongata]
MAAQVPSEVRPRELAVSMEPFSIRVAHAISGEVFLEGDLERGIVPEDSVWMHGGGSGEDGCLLLLRKMNLELLRRHWMHSEMWWPRLFTHHSDIAWDDYEKDYSDLPEEVLEPHQAAELARDVQRRIEAAEKDKREVLQERDDLRKRTRQERLHYMKFGVRKSWVQLHRESMAMAC